MQFEEGLANTNDLAADRVREVSTMFMRTLRPNRPLRDRYDRQQLLSGHFCSARLWNIALLLSIEFSIQGNQHGR